MLVNKNEYVILFDVDDTLITVHKIPGVTPILHNKTLHYPIESSITELKNHKARGAFIRVHSRSGFKWAQTVVKLLKLQDYVDMIETKAFRYYDDVPADEWMDRSDLRPQILKDYKGE